MRWLADVHVRLRPGIADPEGRTIAGALRSLGFSGVEEVRHGKLLRIAFEADGQPEAEARTISLTSTQVQAITSRILPMLDRADQRSLRVRIAAIQNSASNTSMSYLDPAYQDNPVYSM